MSVFEAIRRLRPDAVITVHNNVLTNYYHPTLFQPTDEEIQNEINSIQSQVPMNMLRQMRNQRIQNLDKFSLMDYTFDTSYRNQINHLRQRLRDMPALTSPSLDDNGVLTNVDFPLVESMPTTSIFIKNVTESYTVPEDSHAKFIFCKLQEANSPITITLPNPGKVDGREFYIKMIGDVTSSDSVSVVSELNLAAGTTQDVVTISYSLDSVHLIANLGEWIRI